MSETQAAQASEAQAPVPRDGTAAGQRLKQAREAAGLHVVALAAALKVPVKKLEALEAGRTDELPDATFARALAASVCRQLKLDPAEVLALLPQAGATRLGDEQALNTPFRAPREPAGAPRAAANVPKAVWIALGVLVLAGAVWWGVPPSSERTTEAVVSQALQTLQNTEGETSMGAGAQVTDDAAPVRTEQAPAVPAGQADAASVGAPASPAASAPPAVNGAVVAAERTQSAVVPATTTPAAMAPVITAVPAAAVPAAASAAPAPSADGWLLIRAKADTWVEVNAGGRVVLQRLVKAGESVSMDNAAPLSVVVGRADATEVLVRGKPFDVAAVARNNVARFEVK